MSAREERLKLMKDPEDPHKPKRFKYVILAVLAVILILPYPDRVGGDIDILPPHQQQLQAPLMGEVKEVFYKGGDGTRIARDTIVAKIVFDEVENSILLFSRQIEEKKALARESEGRTGQAFGRLAPRADQRGKSPARRRRPRGGCGYRPIARGKNYRFLRRANVADDSTAL